MKLTNKKENQITFVAEINESLANSIRRYVSRVPILAIDEVEISKNDSPLYDETIAHRLGLIPIVRDKSIDGKKGATLKLNSNKEGFVYSGEMVGKVKVVYDKIPITLLDKEQEIEITSTVREGIGEDHSKFMPGLIYYRDIGDVKIDKDCPQEIAKVCPEKILSVDKGKVIITDSKKCNLCEACVEFCNKVGKESIKISPSKDLIITVESFGQIKPEEIFKESIEVLKKDLKDIEKKLSK
jgi:DNA-directed RNA polymerase subunit D